MTVQYYHEILNAGPIAFLKLLRKWKGGVLKLIYADFMVFTALYTMISCVYRFALRDDMKRQFEKVILYVYSSQSLIPVAFILGFYVSLVFNRFWKHFNTVPWIPKLSLLLSAHLTGDSGDLSQLQDARLQRRSIIRYAVAAQVLTLSRVSVPVKRRFPQVEDLCTNGLLMEHEAKLIRDTEPFTMQPFLPISWSTAIVMKACSQGHIKNEAVLINIVKEINKFRQMLQELFLLDQVCVPLVYTQVVTIAVYSYFLSCLIGRQFIIDPNRANIDKDYKVPIFTILQFIVYMGWLKLALTLVNPMGDDDEDFDLNCIVDYNFEIGMAIVDTTTVELPPLIKDKFFNKKEFNLPMESDMKDSKCKPFMGSVYDMKIENDSWMTSLRSIITLDADISDRIFAHKSLGSLNKSDEDTSLKGLVRTGSSKSQHQYPSGKRPLSVSFSNSIGLTTTTSEGHLEEVLSLIDIEAQEVVNKSAVVDKKKEKQPLIAIEEEEQIVVEVEILVPISEVIIEEPSLVQ